MFDKKIYVLREARCGGTFLSSYIGNKVTERWGVHINSEIYHDTHDFSILDTIIKNDPKAFVIRIDRRNLTEHFLSISAAVSAGFKFTNLKPEEPTNPIWDRIKESTIPVILSDVQLYLDKKINLELKFLETTAKYNIPYTRIWYEDAFSKSFDIPELDLSRLNPGIETDIVATYKLPDYKHDVFPNYNQISIWMRQLREIQIDRQGLRDKLAEWMADTTC